MAEDRRPLVEWLKLDKQTVSDLNRYLYELNVSVRDWFDRNSPTDQATSLERADRQTLYRYINDVRGSLAINEYSLLSSNMTAAAEAAARHAFSYERDYWDMVLSPEEIEQMEAASAATARASLDTVVARYLSSRKTLSDRVYDSALLQSGMLNKIIDTAILRGISWRDLARAVRSSINPRVPGGVSYAAKRLARTEINNAFHATSLQRYKESEIVDFVKWNLSNSHPEGDECDEYADNRVAEHDEAGLWPVDEVPEKPHPNCFCFITPLLPSPEEFLNSLFGEGAAESGSYAMSRNQEEWPDKDDPFGAARASSMKNSRAQMIKHAEWAGVTPDEFLRKANENLKNFTDKLGIEINAPSGVLKKILQDGKYQSVFEVGGGVGDIGGGVDKWYLEFRDKTEKINFGPDVVNRRPVYGSMVGPNWNSGASSYGDVIFVLKPSVRSKSTVTFGDTLNQSGNIIASPIDNPDLYSVYVTEKSNQRYRDVYDGRMDDVTREYVEVQIHGGVSMDEIEEVRYPQYLEETGLVDQETRDLLDKYGIKRTVTRY